MATATVRTDDTPGALNRWLVGALTAGAFALRLVRLGVDSLWYDETVSVYLAGQRIPELIAHTARDIHPPGYYLLLRGWLALTGFPTGHADAAGYRLEFVAAFLSLLFGVLLVPLTWQLARRLRLDTRVAGIAALLVAVSPLGVWYSQEVRMYTLGAALGVVCLLASAPFLFPDRAQRRLGRAAVVYALAAAAGLYTLYYFAFLLVSINLLVIPLLARRWRTTGKAGRRDLFIWLAAQLGTLLLFAPWLPTAWRQATDPPVPPWRSAPQLGASLVESWSALSLG
ncbi:MAG: glycosyltransferase family 39 protein, partial [Caldilineales bacterium]